MIGKYVFSLSEFTPISASQASVAAGAINATSSFALAWYTINEAIREAVQRGKYEANAIISTYAVGTHGLLGFLTEPIPTVEAHFKEQGFTLTWTEYRRRCPSTRDSHSDTIAVPLDTPFLFDDERFRQFGYHITWPKLPG